MATTKANLAYTSSFFIKLRKSQKLRSGCTVRQSFEGNRNKNSSLKCRCDVNWDAYRRTPLSPSPAQRSPVKQFDFLVVGSGIAGLSYALKVAEYGRVAILTKNKADVGCTSLAQGGVSAVLSEVDSVEDHVRDTLVAGVYLNDKR